MSLRVYTARLPHHRCRGYTRADRLDVTRGSGGDAGAPFAPSAELLREAQRLKRTAKRDERALAAVWAWYAPRYVEEMRASWRRNPGAWQALLSRDEVTLCCYCGTAHRCHRRLLAEILAKCGAIDCGEREAA